jgi:hypothetical protein
MGWALAASTFVERGEARVLRLLGERPARTVARLAVQCAVLMGLLGAVSWGAARESTEPGRIVSELIADGRVACAAAATPRTYTVPFFDATWLCGPGLAPRLVGQGPGPLAALVFSARDARASGDLGTIELDDVHLALPRLSLHVDALRLRGTAPWGHASLVSPVSRALTLAPAVALSALAVVALVLLQRTGGRIGTLAVGAAGPVAVLAMLRVMERFTWTRSWAAATIPAVAALAIGAPLAMAWAARLPGMWQTASR